jgi:hypothetical protein
VLTGQDDAEYILLGQALARASYRELWRVDTPVHSQYPPGYPALLQGWQSVTGSSHSSRVALSILLSAATLALVFGAARRRLGEPVAFASAAALAVNPFVVQYGGQVAAEMPYMFCTAACLYALTRADDDRRSGSRSSTRWLIAAAVAMLAAAQMRSIGVALFASFELWLLLTRRWRAAIGVGLVGAATIGGWLVWTTLAPEQFVGRSYVADILDDDRGSLLTVFLGRAASNGWVYATQGVPWVVAFPTIQGTVIDNIVGLLIVGGTLLGGVFVLARRWGDAVLYVGAYAAVLLVFRWQLTRFLVPLVIVLVPAMLVGVGALAGRIRQVHVTPSIVVLALLLCWGSVPRSAALIMGNACNRSEDLPERGCLSTPEQESYFDALRFIRSGLPDDAVLLTVKSGPLFYYTGRRSISVEAARVQHTDDFIDFVKSQGASHVLLAAVDDIERGFFAPLLQANCHRVRLMETFSPGVLLFALDAGDSAGPGDSLECEAIERYRAMYPPLN